MVTAPEPNPQRAEAAVNEAEKNAILTIALMAAFADATKDERERAQLKSIADALSSASSVDLASIYLDVMLKRRSLGEAAKALQSTESQQLAFEMAVCVCDADGVQNDAERKFLAELRGALNLDVADALAYAKEADAVATVPLAEPPPGPVVAAQPVSAAELDKTILNYAILNGALELLPQSLATMAIIPLQMKLVYRVGKAYGYELDRSHIKELLATLGVGLTSQYVEEVARKLIGGLLRKVAGGLGGALGRQATSSAMAFATTYALGEVAKQYYAGGRTLSMDKMKGSFQAMLGQAQGLRDRYTGEIEQKARTIDVNQVASLIKAQ
jgi:uncharacterized protein (DUF697 family)/tellurite resistance protein